MIPSIFQKLNLKEHKTIYVKNSPESFGAELEKLALNYNYYTELSGLKSVDFAVVFVCKKAEVDAAIDSLDALLNSDDPILWMCYPKGSSKKYKCDFNRDNGWNHVGSYGWEPVRMVAIDDDWSALRFRRTHKIKKITRSWTISK
jgi:hypothetical protein